MRNFLNMAVVALVAAFGVVCVFTGAALLFGAVDPVSHQVAQAHAAWGILYMGAMCTLLSAFLYAQAVWEPILDARNARKESRLYARFPGLRPVFIR